MYILQGYRLLIIYWGCWSGPLLKQIVDLENNYRNKYPVNITFQLSGLLSNRKKVYTKEHQVALKIN